MHLLVHIASTLVRSGKLLLDEEGPQMRQLPRAGDTQDGHLDERPPHNTRVGRLGLVAELGLTLLHQC